MVSAAVLQKNSAFLKSLTQTSDGIKLKSLIATSANSCLKVLVLLVKDFIYKKIPLELTEDEKKKLYRYKKRFRQVASLGSKRTR